MCKRGCKRPLLERSGLSLCWGSPRMGTGSCSPGTLPALMWGEEPKEKHFLWRNRRRGSCPLAS